MPNQNQRPLKVFYSYAHEDKLLRDELDKHLAALQRSGVLSSWSDREIQPGQDWGSAINAKLEEADIILLLVSANFLASEYCYDIEMSRALERHAEGKARVIPVILRPCLWEGAPFAHLQAVPRDGRPVTSWENLHAAFFDVVEAIHRVATELGAMRKREATHEKQSTSSLQPIQNLPQRNPQFCGREVDLARLEQSLEPGTLTTLLQMYTITGIGGIGKTQLALEYAYRHLGDYQVVWWIHAISQPSIAADYAALAQELKLPQWDAPNQDVVMEAVNQWLENHTHWLLIFDDASSPQEVEALITMKRTGHVIITSRSPISGRVATPIYMGSLSREESIHLLSMRLRDAPNQDLDTLAEVLGDHPLALELAATYVERTGTTLEEFVDSLEHRVDNLLGEPKALQRTIGTVWETSFRRVQEKSPAGADLLRLCAFFAPDEFPVGVIQSGGKYLPEKLRTVANNMIDLKMAVDLLAQYSLASLHGDALVIHPLIQAMTRDSLTTQEKREWSTCAVKLCNAALKDFPHDSFDADTAAIYDHLLPHALTAAIHAKTEGVALDAAARIYNQIARYKSMRGQYSEARSAIEHSLEIDERALGPDHPNIAVRLNNLGSILQAMGDVAGAKAAFERALIIDEKALGPDHADVARDLGNMGAIFREVGDVESAKAAYERALRIGERAFGSSDPRIIAVINNLGGLQKDLGNLVEAKSNFEQALAIQERSLGPEHPATAAILSNLGGVLYAMGDLASARAAYERALAIQEGALGPDHPEVATVLNNLGHIIHEQGDLTGARAIYERSLVIDQKSFGHFHPQIATSLMNIGLVLRDIGDIHEARIAFQRALAIDENAFGPDHARVKIGRQELSELMQRVNSIH